MRASVIIRLSHLTLYPSMLFGVPRLKKSLSALLVSGFFVAWLACSSNYNYSGGQGQSKLAFRAFVSNPLRENSSGAIFPDLDIVDATKDVESASGVQLLGILPDAGMMVLTPKQDRTLVVSPSSNRIAVVNNSTEAVATAISLPGATESLFVWTDNTSAFVAIPGAFVQGQAPGAVGRVDIVTSANTAIIPIPGAHYLVPSPTGNQILVFSDNSDAVTLLFPALLGTGSQTSSQVPCTGTPIAACTVSGFDRPAWGVFSADGSTAYIMNCGPECSGSSTGSTANPCPGMPAAPSLTSVAVLDMTKNPPVITATLNVLAGTTGLLQGNTLYVSGTPESSAANPTYLLCGQVAGLGFSFGAQAGGCSWS